MGNIKDIDKIKKIFGEENVKVFPKREIIVDRDNINIFDKEDEEKNKKKPIDIVIKLEYILKN